MSSPGARQRRRREQYQSPRTRREVATAAAAVVVIVGGTAAMIWMLRPGGIADRQPKATWLVFLAIGAAAIACYVILRPSSRIQLDKRVALASSLGLILAVAVIAGVVWPDGLLRHPFTVPFTTTPSTPTTQTPSPGVTTTTVAGGSTTTAAGGTTTTAPAGTTTAPTQTTSP
jgi:cytochrome bd-type quinol oxidase subunit 2